MNDFVVPLIGSGTFGWPPLVGGESKQDVNHIRHGSVHFDRSNITDDCCIDSSKSDVTVTSSQKISSDKKLTNEPECPKTRLRKLLETV